MKKFLGHIEEYISVVGLIIMTSIAFMNVLSRKLLGMSWSFTEEITTNVFILISLLGAAIAAKKSSHLGLTILYDLVPKTVRKYLILFTTLVGIFFSVILLIFGVEMVMSEINSGQLTPALGWPEWIFGSFVPIGAAFILIRVIQAGISNFKAEKKGEVE